jgi:NodT family efflux transporter outer membrane factor (OMF) lipoprotein
MFLGLKSSCVLLLATATLLSGCASLLVHPTSDVSNLVAVPPTWDQGVAVTDPTKLAHWWQRFGDAQLAKLVTLALAKNTDVRTAQATLRQAREQGVIAVAGLFPTVGGTGSASRTKTRGSNAAGNYSVGIDASWEPDIFGGVAAGVAAADANTQATALSLANVQVSIAAEVATQYITWAGLTLRLAIARDNLASQEETQQITEWRAQAGLVTSLDVEQARTSTETTRAQIPALESSIAQAQSGLALLTGTTPEALNATLRKSAAVPAADDGLTYAFPAQTLRQRPDVHAAEAQVKAAASRVTAADAERYPSFNLAGSIGVSSLTLAGLTGGGALAASLLGGVSVPIFNAGALEAQVRVQDAALDQARIAYEATVLAALKEVEDSLIALRSSRERLATLQRAADAAKNASLLARYRYSSGLIDFTAVLQTQASLLSVQDSVANGQAELAIAHVRLYKALGGGWQPDTSVGTANLSPTT